MIQCDALRREKVTENKRHTTYVGRRGKVSSGVGGGESEKIYYLSDTYPTESPRSIYK